MIRIKKEWILPVMGFMALAGSVLLSSCTSTVGLYEKTASFASHEWSSDNKPSFTFEISDTTHPYQLFFVVRHTDAYRYKNIWVNIQVKAPDSTYTVQRQFTLADGEKWLGSGMDDVFEHRIAFSKGPGLLKKGTYTFQLQQVMREDPLQSVLNAGIRIEKQ